MKLTWGDRIAFALAWLLMGAFLSIPAGYAAWGALHAALWICWRLGASEDTALTLAFASALGTYGWAMTTMCRWARG